MDAPAHRRVMAAPYDGIAESYRRSKASPVRACIEVPTFARLVGDVTGLRVLDLACGEGFYCRWLRRHGATEVVGVDLSGEMIALAASAEREAPLGIRYLRADVASLPPLGCFDLVTAAYLLHYAPDRDGLFRMAERIAASLRPGGRFVALVENPDQPGEPPGGYAAYGFGKALDGPPCDGAPIHYWMVAGRELFRFDVRYFRRETYAAALVAAGLGPPAWQPLVLDVPGDAPWDPDYFAAYLAHPPVAALECRR